MISWERIYLELLGFVAGMVIGWNRIFLKGLNSGLIGNWILDL